MKPLLAATLLDPITLPYPVLVSAKLDGIRALKHGPHVVSRNLKPIRNVHIQQSLKGLPEGLDGELIVGAPNEGLVFNRTTSGVMSGAGKPDFKFYVFDTFGAPGPFTYRHEVVCKSPPHPFVQVVHHQLVKDPEEFYLAEQRILDQGYEGVMVRGPNGIYKYGRSTHNDGIIWKWKRFRDGEAYVVSVQEGVTNNNDAVRNALGRLERSSHQDNLVPSGVIGKIIGKDLETGKVFTISPGKMEHDKRKYYFENQGEIIGKIAKYKVFDYGAVDASRFCTFQGFRDKADM